MLHFEDLTALFVAELAWLLVRSKRLLFGLVASTNIILVACLVARHDIPVGSWKYIWEHLMPLLWTVCCIIAVGNRGTREQSISILMPNLLFASLSMFYWRDVGYAIEIIAPNIATVAAAGASSIWARRRESLAEKLLAKAVALVWAVTLLESLQVRGEA